MATIVQILPSLHAGGVERGCVEIATAIVAAGHRALVISEGGKMVSEVEAVGAQHITLPVAEKSLLRVRSRACRLADTLCAEGVDLLHYRSRLPGWLSLWANRMVQHHNKKIPLVSTYHGTYLASNPLKRLYNSVMIRSDRIIAPSEAIRRHIFQQYPALSPAKLSVIPRGCDLAAFRPKTRDSDTHRRWSEHLKLDPDIPILLMVGRLTSLKGAAFLAQSLAHLADLSWQWLIVGEHAAHPDEMRRIRHTLARADCESRLHLLGVRRDLPDIYPHVDLLVSASLQPESFGRTVIEAAACGIPAVVPDQGGTAEVVLDQNTGWQYPLGDVRALTDTLRRVLNASARKRAIVGESARQRVAQHYRLEDMQRATLTLYSELLDSTS